MAQNQGPPQQPTNNRNTIYIEKLEQGVTEDYLFHKFKDCGNIVSLRIVKDRNTQKSKGYAYITYSNSDFADEARKRFNNQVLIKNTIRVKQYFNHRNADKKANIFINNLAEQVQTEELEQTFSQYGNVQSLEIKQDDNGKSLGYGYIQFEKKEDVDKLMEQTEKQPIVIKGKTLVIERFRAQQERRTESSCIFFRAFTRPLTQKDHKDETQTRIYEHGWKLQFHDFFKNQIKECFVKFDKNHQQPWAFIQFENVDDAKAVLDECEKTRFHSSLNSSSKKIRDLFAKSDLPIGSDGIPLFAKNQIEEFLNQFIDAPDDPYKGGNKEFFFNKTAARHLNQDERLLLVQNIREDVQPQQLKEFLSKFGVVLRLTLKKSRNPKFKVQFSFVHYQTFDDATTAQTRLYDQKDLLEEKQVIFTDNPKITILVPKAVRRELKQIRSQSMAQNPQRRNMYLPYWATPPLPMQQANPQFLPGPPQRPPYQQQQRGPGMGIPTQAQYPPRGPRPYPPGVQGRGQGGFPPNQRPVPPYQIGRGQQGMPGMGGMPPQAFQQGMPPMPVQMPPMQMQGGMFPMQQMPPQMGQMGVMPGMRPPQVGQAMQQPRFPNYDTIKKNMGEFTRLSTADQRQILGKLLTDKIHPIIPPEFRSHVPKIIGMLTDEQQFEINEIINYFEDDMELKDRITEAIDLITEDSNQSNAQN